MKEREKPISTIKSLSVCFGYRLILSFCLSLSRSLCRVLRTAKRPCVFFSFSLLRPIASIIMSLIRRYNFLLVVFVCSVFFVACAETFCQTFCRPSRRRHVCVALLQVDDRFRYLAGLLHEFNKFYFFFIDDSTLTQSSSFVISYNNF